jgi:hypothetical protein
MTEKQHDPHPDKIGQQVSALVDGVIITGEYGGMVEDGDGWTTLVGSWSIDADRVTAYSFGPVNRTHSVPVVLADMLAEML